jgi:ferritin-like metal-binding protein YciE
MLESATRTLDDDEVKEVLRLHKIDTERHIDRLRERLDAHGTAPSLVREAGGIVGALMKSVLDMTRPEKAGRNARDGYATEHMEVAAYELLARIADRAGDEETAAAAREIIGEEQAMAKKIEANWDRFAELSLREQGIVV